MFKNIILSIFAIINLSNQCSVDLSINKPTDFSFSGDATAYGGNSNSGFCGFKEKSFLYSNKMQVALNEVQWNNSLNCGRCVNIKYENNPPVKALISDKCPECKYGDLDLFLEAYSTIIKKSPGREKIQWNFITCNEFVDQNIRFRIDYINQYWLSINPENFLCGISNMEISFNDKWIDLDRTDNTMNGLYFNYHGFVQVPFKLRITSINNEKFITQNYNKIEHILSTNFQFNC